MNTLINLIEEFGKRDRLAIKYKNDYRTFSHSYAELYRLINQCVNYLKTEERLRAGDKVAIWGPNSPEWVTAFFAVIGAGGIVVPIDYKATAQNAEKIIANAGVKLAIKSKYRPAVSGRSLMLENLRDMIAGFKTMAEYAGARKHNLAELVYTSGTTGDPKGVMITHHNLLSNIEAVIRHINVNENDQMLSVLPLSHLFEQTCNMLAGLYVGASVVYLETLKPSLIFRALAEERITVFIMVPRLLQGFKNAIREKFSSFLKKMIWQWLNDLGERFPQRRKSIFFFIHEKFGKNFRFFVSGGASLDLDTENFWRRLGFIVIQGYGLTECSPILTANKENDNRAGSVGLPLDNVQLDLSADQEVIARGPNIFPGYYHDKEKTKAAFRDNWFLTGDIGTRDAAGYYYIKGRKKDVIVTAAGVNVYPEDIEALLNEQTGIQESCVIGLPSESGEKIQAVLIMKDTNADAAKIIDQVNKKLDSSQQIVGFTVWPETEFPKTTTLKIKKNAVKEIIGRKNVATASDRAADKLINIISEITHMPAGQISTALSLAGDLQLDSIGRVELVSRIEQEYNVDFEEDLIDTRTTVSDLKAMVEQKKRQASKYRMVLWPFRPWAVGLRRFLMDRFGLNVLCLWCRVNIKGQENLAGLKGPVIITPNHASYFDQGAVLMSLPSKIKYNLATAAWGEFFAPPRANFPYWLFRRLNFYFAALVFGVFPLWQTKFTKKNLQYVGRLADRGFNILVFPEGERTRTDNLLTFKAGAALLSRQLRLPIIPVGITGTEKVLPRGHAIPRRGEVRVNFGQPLHLYHESDSEIIMILKMEIEKLRQTAID